VQGCGELIYTRRFCLARIWRGADLREATLFGVDLREAILYGTDFCKANLREANLYETDLGRTKLCNADLRGANLCRANLRGVNLCGVILNKAFLREANLREANLGGVEMNEVKLGEARLIKANLSQATLTGAELYGTARDDWTIDGILCDFVYWGEKKEHRVPKDRDFRPGEFEELYKHLPTFEYYFEQGFTPLDSLIMNKVVQTVNERRPEIELKLDSFHSRGQPHATFTVLDKDYVKDTLEEVRADYETRLKVLEGQKEQLMQVIAMGLSGGMRLQSVNNGINLRSTLLPELAQQIVQFLGSLPGLEKEDARRAWIYGTGLDAALQQQIQIGGAPLQFFQLLVHTVASYGKLRDGRLAIAAVLDAAKVMVGPDRQKECDLLIQKVQTEYQN